MSVLSFPLLSEVQCATLLHDAVHLSAVEGRVYGEQPQAGEVKPDTYQALERFIDLQPPHTWLRPLLHSVFDRACVHYGTRSVVLVEMPRLLTYAENGHFAWHVDAVSGMAALRQFGRPVRRLTGSIQLADADAYSGGDLHVCEAGQMHVASRVRGAVTVFPATWWHRVTPVTSRVRAALVFWGYA